MNLFRDHRRPVTALRHARAPRASLCGGCARGVLMRIGNKSQSSIDTGRSACVATCGTMNKALDRIDDKWRRCGAEPSATNKSGEQGRSRMSILGQAHVLVPAQLTTEQEQGWTSRG
jgi:hypothetical protein